MSNYLDTLNEAQKAAVLHTDGPCLVIAGAGSGKTRVLTYRIAHILEKGEDAFRIMALTFTNKAAGEMRERIEKLVGTEARNLWMGTFHSVFARILRIEADRLGYPKDFTIYDTDDSRSLIKSILKENNLDDKIYKPNIIHGRISELKNKLISPAEYARNMEYYQHDVAARRPEFGRIYQIYSDRCFKSGAMDFDDLLYNTNILFRDHIDVLNKYQQKFKYILVDEYQDTNLSQYLIIRKLVAVHRNICVVGDDAQSIYAFRGADIQNILNFERDYPDFQLFKLERNYRSTNNIVQAANCVIKHNKHQLSKNVYTENGQGDLIEVVKCHSDNEEAKIVADSIFETKLNQRWTNNDFAILYRTNAQSRALEEALRRRNIKYRIIGGLSFYQRKEIKDLIAYLRLIVNPNDEEALKRVINYPKRGIGDTSVAKLIVTAIENGVPLWDVIQQPQHVLGGNVALKVESFGMLIKSFQSAAQIKNAYDIATQVAKESGILRELYEDKTVEGISRYENLQELLNAIKEFIDNPENEDKDIGTFLQQVSLLTSADTDKDKNADAVTLMTVHGAKGLEFKHVFVVGLEEGLFPSKMMLENKADLEEERRLFYVAITRAEQKLTLTYATSRYFYGNVIESSPSRFLEEIDYQYLKTNYKKVSPQPATEIKNSSFTAQFKKTVAPPPAVKKTEHIVSSNFVPSPVNLLKVGARVEHQKFGFGTITQLDVSGNTQKATVNFDNEGEKTLVLSFAKLMLI
jgi:DNA helicase-2/ATP-dependent DNA helicase PcrA